MQGGRPIAVRARIDVRVIYVIGTEHSQSDCLAVRDSGVFLFYRPNGVTTGRGGTSAIESRQ